MGHKDENASGSRSRNFYGMSRQERLKAYDPELDFLKPYVDCLNDEDCNACKYITTCTEIASRKKTEEEENSDV
jgi:hypothetical protein